MKYGLKCLCLSYQKKGKKNDKGRKKIMCKILGKQK